MGIPSQASYNNYNWACVETRHGTPKLINMVKV